MKNKLKAAYNPDAFRENGHRMIDLLVDYLEEVRHGTQKVMDWKEPDEQYEFWKNYNPGHNDPVAFLKDVIEKSIHIHNPRYMGHQVSAPAPVTALADMVSALLNNGMAIYEMGPVSSALEKWIIGQFAGRLGFGKNGDGLLTSGGTLGMLTALLAARQVKGGGNIWEEGNPGNLAVLIPEESHYSVERAARIMGFGSKGIIKIPADENYRMQTSVLESYLDKAHKEGKKVIAVTANACSTATGTYDNLNEIGNFCRKYDLWFHVDGAHGGAAIFSEKYKHLLDGIHLADSVTIDLHKMLMTPALATALIFRNKSDSYATFNQQARYLLNETSEEQWYDYAKRTMECTKVMISVKFYALVHTYDFEIFDQNVTTLYDLAKTFAETVKNRPAFELAVEPESNIVCFRILAENEMKNNKLNSAIRQRLLEEGDFYIVQTVLKGEVFLRVTIMNPLTEERYFKELLDKIEMVAKTFELT